MTNGVEAEVNNGNLTAADLTYVRLDNMGAGVFQAYRGSGPDDAHITWTPAQDAMAHPQRKPTRVWQRGPLQVGLAAGAIGALPGASVLFDWAEIQTTTQTYRDDFNYTRDFAANGVLGFNAGATSGGAIWNAIENASAGGTPTVSGANLARCVACTWSVNGSGNFGVAANYGQSFLIGPSQNDNTVLFGNALTGTGTTAVVYANQNATVKELDFDNANKYVLAGPATITLDADSGNSVIHVISGAHEIQTKLSLNKNVVATAEAGTTLNVNAQVFLNGHTFTTAGTGIINLNDGTVSVGSGAGAGGGAGSLVNEGNLSGLGGLEGNLVQTSGGSLALEVGSNPVAIQGSADLSGTLNLSLAPGFVPQSGQSYTLLTADSVTSSGLSLGGAAAGLFHLVVGADSVSLVGVPEPSTLTLAAIGLAIGGGLRLRRRSGAQRRAVAGKMLFLCGVALGLVVLISCAAEASTLTPIGGNPTTYTDDFNSTFNYESAGGAAPANTLAITGGGTASWSGTYNQTNGGGDFNGSPYHAVFQSNGVDFNGTPTPGQLGIEDAILHVNAGGTTGVGWGDADANSAPMLYTNVDAGNDFDAVMKISSQTAGNWSYAPIIARIHGPSVGHGPDATDPLDQAERFVTGGSFITNPATPTTATLLIQADGKFNGGTTITENETNSAVVTGICIASVGQVVEVWSAIYGFSIGRWDDLHQSHGPDSHRSGHAGNIVGCGTILHDVPHFNHARLCNDRFFRHYGEARRPADGQLLGDH